MAYSSSSPLSPSSSSSSSLGPMTLVPIDTSNSTWICHTCNVRRTKQDFTLAQQGIQQAHARKCIKCMQAIQQRYVNEAKSLRQQKLQQQQLLVMHSSSHADSSSSVGSPIISKFDLFDDSIVQNIRPISKSTLQPVAEVKQEKQKIGGAFSSSSDDAVLTSPQKSPREKKSPSSTTTTTGTSPTTTTTTTTITSNNHSITSLGLQLHQAIHNGEFDTIIHLLSLNPKCVNVPDVDTGRNPLHMVLTLPIYHEPYSEKPMSHVSPPTSRRYHLISAMLEAGASPNAGTFLGRERPLHFAAMIDDTQIADLLIGGYKADPFLVNNLGRSPIFYAKSHHMARLFMQGDRGETLEILVDKEGKTPLVYALSIGDEHMVRYWTKRADRRVRGAESKAAVAAGDKTKLYGKLDARREENLIERQKRLLQAKADAAGQDYLNWKNGEKKDGQTKKSTTSTMANSSSNGSSGSNGSGSSTPMMRNKEHEQ